MKRRCPEIILPWYNIGMDMSAYLTNIAEAVQAYDYACELTLNEEKHVELKFGTPRADKNDYIEFPPILIEIFGFTEQSRFYSGTYTSEMPYSTDIYPDINPEEKFKIELSKINQFLITMEEPDTTHYTDVVAKINDAFDRWISLQRMLI